MRPECSRNTGFIRGHCGSVAIEALQGRATGAQRHLFNLLPSVHLQGNGTGFHSNHPAGQTFPSGTCLLRVFNP
ncbi:MAG: hypothetical protein AB2693_11315 [Candidatus Thiodiazotropha sp.]